jgi:hypothetical protein
MPKTPWEHRVRMLLNKPEIVWCYKAPDGKMYGGQPRIDFVACDIFGRFIMVEVKSLIDASRSFLPKILVPAVQRDALNKIAGTASGVAILAVGHKNVLRLYNWGHIRDLPHISVEGTESEGTFWVGVWNGPTNWAQQNLHVILVKNWQPEPGPYSGLGPLAYVSTASIWTPSYSAQPDPPPEITSPLILPPSYVAHQIPTVLGALGPKPSPSQGATRPVLGPIQNPAVERAKPVPPAPPPEKTSGEKRKEILKQANRQHHARQ